jgi:rhomboid protease GluP
LRITLPESAPYITYSLIGVTVFVYLLQLASQAFLKFDFPVGLLAKSNDLIRDGQLWRLLTPALVHGGFAHIGFNMYALFIFGVGLERAFGHWRFFCCTRLARSRGM